MKKKLYYIAVFMVCGTLDITLNLLVKTELMAGLWWRVIDTNYTVDNDTKKEGWLRCLMKVILTRGTLVLLYIWFLFIIELSLVMTSLYLSL